MGGIRDEALDKCHETGAKQAFFAENSPESADWGPVFQTIARELGFAAIYYAGAGRSIRPTEPGYTSAVDDEMRDDLYPSQTIVIYLGQPKANGDFEDHWVLDEATHLQNRSHNLLVYTCEDFPLDVLRRHNIELANRVVRTIDEFKFALREDLTPVSKNLGLK